MVIFTFGGGDTLKNPLLIARHQPISKTSTHDFLARSRKNQASFVCTTCGHRDNADRNAAVVILNRGNIPGVEPCHWAGVEARTVQAA